MEQPQGLKNFNDNAKFGWVNHSFLKAALLYCQGMLNDMMVNEFDESDLQDDHKHDEFFKKNCFKAEYRLSNNLKEILYMYAQVDFPFTQRDPEFIELEKYKREALYSGGQN